jgi:N-acetylmuramoyl-L-alanine amidase
MKPLSVGDRGPAVSDVQKRLRELGFLPPGLEEEARRGYYGEATAAAVRDFQRKRGLREDGRVDESTWQELVEASFRLGDRFLYLRIPPFRGDDVRELQGYLNRLGFNAGREDGIFGRDTDRALRAFQHEMGLPADGIAGSSTLSCLRRLKHVLKDTSVAEIHEILQDRDIRGTEGRKVVLDAEEGDAGAERLLLGVSPLLVRGGVTAIITGGASNPLPESQRARLANDREADLVLGLRLLEREGFQAFYFRSGGYSSPRGRRMAEVLAAALEGRLGKRVHPPEGKSYPLLRETRMPCVILEGPRRLDDVSGLAEVLAESVFDYFLHRGENRGG